MRYITFKRFYNSFSPRSLFYLLVVLGSTAGIYCDSDILSPKVVNCPAGEMRCAGNGVIEICSLDGTNWQKSACPPEHICVTSACENTVSFRPTCRRQICTPGTTRCNPEDNIRVEKCDNNGTQWCCYDSCIQSPSGGVCYQGSCVSVCSVTEKSYIGCDYFAVDLDNAVDCGASQCYDAAGSQFAVVLSNPTLQETVFQITLYSPPKDQSIDVCVKPAHIAQAGIIPPKGLKIVELPRRDVNGTTQDVLAYRITSNSPITVYQFNPLENENVFSNDASLLLPTNTAGQNYFVMSREQMAEHLKAYVTVVGIQKTPTQVTVFPTAKTLAGTGIPPMLAGQSFTTSLRRHEVLNIETNRIGDDLTGSYVTADQPVIVFGGSEAADAPNTSHCNMKTLTCDWRPSVSCACTEENGSACSEHEKCRPYRICCADHIEQQLFPLSTWGNHYVAARSKRRAQEKDIWRILAGYDNTVVQVSPRLDDVERLYPPELNDDTPVEINQRELNIGEWFEFESNADFVIQSTQPILVGQFLAGEFAPEPYKQAGDAKTGDPAFTLAVPVHQFRENYVFLVPNKYADDYVTLVTVKGSAVLLDNKSMADYDPLASEMDIVDIANSNWRIIRLRVNDGFHILNCPKKCSVMVHGYDQYVSYAYPGGLNLGSE